MMSSEVKVKKPVFCTFWHITIAYNSRCMIDRRVKFRINMSLYKVIVHDNFRQVRTKGGGARGRQSYNDRSLVANNNRLYLAIYCN